MNNDTKAKEWFEAQEKYGYDEAVHVVAELWGYSVYQTERLIDKIEEDLWL
jgi:hypothetical protein|tara:strand:+ start:3219 stop:3371 length:153 start_codon:yes stop_codon:yes gene_type:complete